jgi:hypothetical protein
MTPNTDYYIYVGVESGGKFSKLSGRIKATTKEKYVKEGTILKIIILALAVISMLI